MTEEIELPKYIESGDKDERRRLKSSNRMNNLSSWRLYRQNEHVRPSSKEILEKAEHVAKYNLRIAALYSLAYLSGCRGQELTRYYRKLNGVVEKLPSITIGQLNKVEIGSNSYIKISNRILKLREDKIEVYAQNKLIPYSKHDSAIYGLITIVESYIDSLQITEPSTELFPFSYQYGRTVLEKEFTISIHVLRRWRCQNLTQDYNLSPEDLKAWMGWKSDGEPMHYSQASQQSITNRFEREVIFEDEEEEDGTSA
jgi:hypothetical protein